MNFQELGLSKPLLQALDEIGFASPMPIQEAVIPQLLEGEHDLVGLAQTGTGKTAAYGLPLIQNIDLNNDNVQAVVVCPTRELCLQIADDLTEFSRYLSEIRILPVYGGTSIDRQIQKLKKGVHIIVATPGRLIDLNERGAAKLSSVKRIVLDEADEMLNMGFSEDIEKIFGAIAEDHITLLFSATMSREIERIAKKFLRNAVEVQIGSRNEGAEKVNHEYYLVHASDKYAALKRIVDYYPRIYAIIFCRTKVETQEVADKLIQDGYNAEALHGDLSQQQRDITMGKFRNHNTQFLVATDVAARGLDVEELTHVINYGLPDDIEQYTHRSGRTGRAGKKGTSISIIHLREQGKVRNIEKTIGKQFVKKSLPSAKEICTKQLFNAIDTLERTDVNEKGIAPFLDEVFHKLEWLNKEEIIKRFVTIEFGRFLDYYANAPEIEEPQQLRKRQSDKSSSGSKRNSNREKGQPEEGYTRYFIPLGRKDGFMPRDLLTMLNKCTRQPIEVGKIDLGPNFSYFEVPSDQAHLLEKSSKEISMKGKHFRIEQAAPLGEAGGGRHSNKKKKKSVSPTQRPDGKRYKPYHKNRK